MSGTIERELLDAAKAVGILTASGGLNAAWFQHPDQKLSTILSNPEQRAAFLDLLDAVAPHANIPGLPAGEKWHPLLGNQPRGNLYLSVNSAGPVVFGLAGELKGGASPAASLRAHLPFVNINGSSITRWRAQRPVRWTWRYVWLSTGSVRRETRRPEGYPGTNPPGTG